MAYKLTVQAEQDFYEIYAEGAAQFGENQADRYLAGLLRIFDLLSDNPMMARERTEVNPPVRIHPYQAHLVIYTIQSDDVLILGLPRGNREWQRLLNP